MSSPSSLSTLTASWHGLTPNIRALHSSGCRNRRSWIPGISPDIVALITLNLRAIGEYATYYGFDVSSQQERLFAMNVLGLASSPTDASKGLAMAQLVRIAQDVAKKRTWRQLEQHAFVQLIQQLAKALGFVLRRQNWPRLFRQQEQQSAEVSTHISRRRFATLHTTFIESAFLQPNMEPTSSRLLSNRPKMLTPITQKREKPSRETA